MRRCGLAVLLCVATVSPAFAAGRFDNYPEFQFGPTGMVVTITGGTSVNVKSVTSGTPADGVVLSGDTITAVGGKSLAGPDVRVMLGKAINAAEAADGKLALTVRRGGAVRNVTVALPAIGGFSKTWPVDCGKSRTLIAQTVKFLVANQDAEGAFTLGRDRFAGGIQGSMAALFLLSTGDAKCLPNVRLTARSLATRSQKSPSTSMWHLGYEMILLGEYYIATGDRAVLPALKAMADHAAKHQYVGGWSHGSGVNPGYTQGGLMNSAGVTVLTGMVLARECGVAVSEPALRKGIKLMFRMIGHGSIPYGDHRAEIYAHTNGRNMATACTFSLLDGEQYKMAAALLGAMAPDSYYIPEAGHTGGGLGVMWRGIGSMHVPAARKASYRRQMDILAWYYDLARVPGGGFSMLPSPPKTSRYCGLGWGTGAVGMAFTAPLRTLRITGGKPTAYSVRRPSPKVAWGNAADVVFRRSDHCEGFGTEKLAPHEVYNAIKVSKNASTTCVAKLLRHYNPVIRVWAALLLAERGDKASVDALAAAAVHSDARVRHAGLAGAGVYNSFGRAFRPGKISRETITARFGDVIAKVLNDPHAAWWEADGALWALRNTTPATIRKHLPAIRRFARHEDWWLREAALMALGGLGEYIADDELVLMAEMYATETNVFFRGTYYMVLKHLFGSLKTTMDPAARATLVATFGKTLHTMTIGEGYGENARHEAAHRTMMILDRGLGGTKFEEPRDDFRVIRDDIVKYLQTWKPSYQHSGWLITGNGWQRGFIKIAEQLGPDGKLIKAELQKCYDQRFRDDTTRSGQRAKAAFEEAGYGKK